MAKFFSQMDHSLSNIPDQYKGLNFRKINYFLESMNSFRNNIQLWLTIAQIFVFDAIFIQFYNTGLRGQILSPLAYIQWILLLNLEDSCVFFYAFICHLIKQNYLMFIVRYLSPFFLFKFRFNSKRVSHHNKIPNIIYQYKNISYNYYLMLTTQPQNQQTSEHNSYIDTQFFFYLLPCYYALIAFSYRYYVIMKELPQRDVNTLPGQQLVITFQNAPQSVPGIQKSPPPASYVIKSKLCLLNSYLYLFMVILSFIGTPDIFYGSKHKKHSPIYLFGFIAWSLGAIVLRREYRRKINQSLWTHRFFWIFSGTFAITKMFEDYLLPMNFILNIISILSNMVLMVYGLYRPEDNDTLQIIHNEQIPLFIVKFFEIIELNRYVRKIFQIEQLQNKILKEQIQYIENINEEDLAQLQKKFKVTAQTRRQQLNLLNQLPRRNVYIDRKLKYVKNTEGIIKYFYFIITQIGSNRYQASRQIAEFHDLQHNLQVTFNQKNFPSLTLPKLKLSTPQNIKTNEAIILEEWLSEIMKKPIFMIGPLFSFLNIDNQSSAPFLAYFQFSYKSFCSKHYVLNRIIKNRQRQSRHSLVGYYQEERQTTMKMNNYIKQKLKFQIQVNPQITDSNEYGFNLSCIRQDPLKQKINWDIRKTKENIELLNPRIQQQCKLSVTYYYKMVSNLANQKHSVKAQIYLDYLKQLIKNQKYYCPSLFQFLRFDPINVQVKVLGGRIELSSMTNLSKYQRDSHYFQQYEDTGKFIEILRVDRLEEDNSFKFSIRRKGFIVKRKLSQLHKLRQQLSEIYDGISFIPRLFIESCTKKQAKNKAQIFLSSLELLPHIHSDSVYRRFYENTLL